MKLDEYKLVKINNPMFKFGNTIDDVSLRIKHFMNDISKSVSYDQYLDIFERYLSSNKSAIRIDDTLIKDREYYIKQELLSDSLDTEGVLRYLKNSGYSIAPEFIKTVSNNIGFATTIMKIPGATGEHLSVYRENMNKLNNAEKLNAYMQFVKLLNADIVNVDVLRHPEVLKIVQGKENRLVCEDWSNLCTKNEYLMNFEPEGSYFDIVKRYHNIIFGKKES